MIELHEVSKAFNGEPAVRNLSLQITKGEVYGLLGANGAGKSTTIHMLLGFLKPDSGQVKIKDRPVFENLRQTRQLIGYIPEHVELYPYLSGLENLDYFSRLAGVKASQIELKGYLSKCGLAEKDHSKRVSGYSKGMRQKVGIAIALAKHAEVYILDEPASGLDPLASNELSNLLVELAAEGATILMASHDIFRVREVCNRIGILKQGQLLKELLSAELNANQLQDLYLSYMKE